MTSLWSFRGHFEVISFDAPHPLIYKPTESIYQQRVGPMAAFAVIMQPLCSYGAWPANYVLCLWWVAFQLPMGVFRWLFFWYVLFGG